MFHFAIPLTFLPVRISKKLALYTTASQQTILIISQIQELEQTSATVLCSNVFIGKAAG